MSELNTTKMSVAALDEDLRIIKETGSVLSTPQGVSPMAEHLNGNGSLSPGSSATREPAISSPD